MQSINLLRETPGGLVEKWLKEIVFARADGRCEYCLRPAWSGQTPFPIDHIRAQQHGGTTTPDNLALACPACNGKKGPNLTAVDPLTDAEVPIFSPRSHRWREHFTWSGFTIVGRTAVGRATIRLLDLNSRVRVSLREQFAEADG